MTNKISDNQQKNFIEKLVEFIKESIKVTFKYFWSKTLASIVLGLIAYGFLYFIKIDYPGIIGAVTGFFNLIPVIGGLAACVICGIIAVFQSPLSALYVVITILVLQQIDQWILTPLIVGRSVNLPSILIIIALIAGSMLWGPVGVIIAVPIAGAIRAFYSVFIKTDTKKEEQNTVDVNDSDENNKPDIK